MTTSTETNAKGVMDAIRLGFFAIRRFIFDIADHTMENHLARAVYSDGTYARDRKCQTVP